MIMITAAVLLLSTSSVAANVNEKALSAFSKDFAGATNAGWKERDNLYLVEFKVGDVSFNAAYNEDGDLLASSKSLKLEDLPLTVTQAIDKKYTDYEIGNNAAALTFEGKTNYYLTIANSRQVLYIKVSEKGDISIERKTKV